MLNKLKKDNKGFTIIEVMIVLAIAGLIILIVLLAIPALQRNGRNTALKNDASAIAAGVSEFKSNNDGAPPTSISATTITGSGGTQSNVAIKTSSGATVSAGNAPGAGAIQTTIGAACPGSTGNARSVAIYYTPEGSSTVVKCIDA